jgi:hypothetical protein
MRGCEFESLPFTTDGRTELCLFAEAIRDTYSSNRFAEFSIALI